MQRTTWVEVSADALTHNLRAITQHVGVPVCAVVKANAYGHGLVETARTFALGGATMLGVTRIEEARAIRAGGIDAPVLILMPVPDVEEAVALGCAVTVGSEDEVQGLPQGAQVHLKVDTGMGRLGVRLDDAAVVARAIRERATLSAIWTHFAAAASATGRAQLERFRTVVTSLRHEGIDVMAHAANSAAVCALPASTFDMVRVGTLLYGQDPAGARSPVALRPTFTWYARVAAVRTVPAGGTVGYGSEWTAKEAARIATIPVGYADGFGVEPLARTPSLREGARAVARVGKRLVRPQERVVRFGERTAPVVGRIGMQAVSVDVSQLPDVVAGSIAIIPARRLMVGQGIERVLA